MNMKYETIKVMAIITLATLLLNTNLAQPITTQGIIDNKIYTKNPELASNEYIESIKALSQTDYFKKIMQDQKLTMEEVDSITKDSLTISITDRKDEKLLNKLAITLRIIDLVEEPVKNSLAGSTIKITTLEINDSGKIKRITKIGT